MTVDEALKQLSFMKRKGSMYIKEVSGPRMGLHMGDLDLVSKSTPTTIT